MIEANDKVTLRVDFTADRLGPMSLPMYVKIKGMPLTPEGKIDEDEVCVFSLLTKSKWPLACCDRHAGPNKLASHAKANSKPHRKAAEPALKKAALACLIDW